MRKAMMTHGTQSTVFEVRFISYFSLRARTPTTLFQTAYAAHLHGQDISGIFHDRGQDQESGYYYQGMPFSSKNRLFANHVAGGATSWRIGI
jgi:hypothetical protein